MMIQKLLGGFVVGLVVSLLLSSGAFIEWRSAASGPDSWRKVVAYEVQNPAHPGFLGRIK
ncbi:hypothetical protein FACS1894158_02150 [Betaproteobacteria bacterium]|nr:hypothetical protein FACS1894158_02150 [Betaproteobacteria bacterium]